MGSKAFWSLTKSVETNFCCQSLPPLQKPHRSLAHTTLDKTNLFATLFVEYSQLDLKGAIPSQPLRCLTSMPEIRIRQCEVSKTLHSLDVNKARGPDGIPGIVLKTCAPELVPILTCL